ncbi:MAG: glycosyltransferase family 9 protein [Pseudomonadota bacterium]
MARGAAARGKRIAFGDGRKILWDKNSATMFQDNPNIAPPGAEGDRDVEWVRYYKGHRIYNRQAANRWIWNLDFRPIAGEIVFDRNELRNRERAGRGFVVIEPGVEAWKTCAPNKDWGLSRYQLVADALRAQKRRIVQFRYAKGAPGLKGADRVDTLGFRDAVGLLSRASLYIGPEGGLHHAAAAVGIPAVVLFGGFIPPQVTGYPDHANLTGGADKACGKLTPCAHCRAALDAILPVDVLAHALERL